MSIAKSVAFICLAAMVLALLFGFTAGNFSTEGSKLLAMPWGIVSMVDLYAGFTLFSGWIIYREKSIPRSAIWVFFILTLGFFTGSLYTLVALFTSRGDWKRFWMGNRSI
jgi:hypothetical protein